MTVTFMFNPKESYTLQECKDPYLEVGGGRTGGVEDVTGGVEAWTQSRSMTLECSMSVSLIESTLTPFNPNKSSLDLFSSFFPFSDDVELIRDLRDCTGDVLLRD